MTTPASATITPGAAPGRAGNRVFTGLSFGAGSIIMLVLALVTAFLVKEALPAFLASKEQLGAVGFMKGENFWAYVAPLVFGTLWAAALALGMALPLALGIALFISHYAPRRLASVLGYVVDLLAAVPSVVFGLWGITVVAPVLQPLYAALNGWLGALPGLGAVAGGTVSATGRTIFTAAIVLAVMILPIMTALCREVFLRTPTLHEEAALALGATQWEMIRMAVLPHGRAGIVSAAMLGLGRALGETMAVAMVLSAAGGITFRLFTAENPSTIAANIALSFPEAYGTNINVLIATGLVLFIVTFAVNAAARWIVSRSQGAHNA